MEKPIIFDEELCKRLPLPLAQLYRRAHTAKSELELHHVSYYLWEASLKLMATVAVLEYANLSRESREHDEFIQKLAQPQVGHWCDLLRKLLPLAARSDATLHRTNELLLSDIQEELPRCAALDAVLRGAEPNAVSAASKVTLLDLFQRLADYRGTVFNTAPHTSRSASYYENIGQSLLAATSEWLPRIDLLAGQQLIFVSDVTSQSSGRWLVQRYGLMGDIARRIRPLELSGSVQGLPRSGSVCLDAAIQARNMSDTGSLTSLRSLHPLIMFDVGLDQVFFLGSRRGEDAAEYLCYTTGQVLDPKPIESDLHLFLKQLLRHHVDAHTVADWVKQSEAETPDAAFPQRKRSQHMIGEFELLTRMGQGGMGVVYRAWQPSLGRQVAVKSLIRSDRKAEARFSREIHALARVEHPHLVKIFSSGVEGDHWYYAMELVDGVDLGMVTDRLKSPRIHPANLEYGQWIDELNQAVREARLGETQIDDQFKISEHLSRVSANASAHKDSQGYIQHIVELIIQIAQAAQSLHEAGVVHRDIKPGNVMLTADGQNAVLMDLGLAQIADDRQNRVTQTRQFIGTLRYASPEQVLSSTAVDHRSDVYSLGATLWELITFKPLFGMEDESTALELMQRIEYSEPESIRKYNASASKDLDAIVSKCLEKSPDRRYQSAAELSDELTRYLKNEPVLARPLNRIARTTRYIRRHPLGVGLAFTCFSTVVAFVVLGVSTWALRTERQFTKRLQTANQRADQSFRQAVKTLEEIFTLVTEGELRKRPDLQPLRNQLLTYYQQYVQEFDSGKEQDDEMVVEVANVFRRMARITKEIGNKQDAMNYYSSAIAKYQELITRTPDRPNVVDALAQTWTDRGVIMVDTRVYENAEQDFMQAREVLIKIGKGDPKNLEYRRHLAEVYHNFGILYGNQNRDVQAIEAFEQGRQIREQLVTESDDREFKRDLGRSYGYLGDVQIATGDYQAALRSYNRSVEIRQQVADSKPTDHEARFQLSRGFRNLGHLRRLQNDLEESIKWFSKATDEERRLVDEEPLITEYRKDLGRYSNDLAELLIEQGNVVEKPEYFERATKHLGEALAMNQEMTQRNSNDMLVVSALAHTYVCLARLAARENAARVDEQVQLSRQQFSRLTNRTAEDLYQQAVAEALSAGLANANTIPPIANSERHREARANESLSLLSQAVIKSRFTVLPRLVRDTAFKELKDRPDFQMVYTIGFQGSQSTDQVTARGDRPISATPRSPFKHLCALTVGVSDYKSSKYSLQFPDDDAREISEMLNLQPSFDTVNVKTLINEQADRVSILNALKQLRLKALHPSLLLVALSGHGKLHESGDYYFLPYDFDFDPDASIAATGISWDDMLREFKEFPGAVIVVLDTCHSGAATNIGLRSPTSDAMENSVRRAASDIAKDDDKGVAVLASSLSRQAAQERPGWGHGALSLALLEALSNQRLFTQKQQSPLPVLGTNRMLSLEQIRAYAVERVNEITDGQQKVIVQSNMSLIDIPFSVRRMAAVN
jgi:serine/threonine protein kinase/tetratricopeptide (TPR) repeat protein